jgi:Zn-dependent M28 family amino/carboxypeptidase
MKTPATLLIPALAALLALSPTQDGVTRITSTGIRAHLEFLSHDLLEGRAPGTRGGELAAQYIATQFARVGLQPVRGSYFQRVPLVGTTVDTAASSFLLRAGGTLIDAAYADDVVYWLPAGADEAGVEAELIFVGYGVRAPEYGWDDYDGRDVRGRVALILVNDPPAPPDEPELFDGRAMTYYGRWTYKLEEARRQGAAGALLIHSGDAAGYPWNVVVSSWTGEQLALGSAPDDALQLHGWVTERLAQRLLAAGGHALDELAVQAARRDFRPVATGIAVQAALRGSSRSFETANVVGLVPGRHPERRGEVVVYTAHYDHMGIGAPVDGDSIYSGAYDNASGVAALIEIAGAYASLTAPPERSVLFMATTAEEAGLLGATYYVRQPLFPLARTMAAINLDGANVWGETDDMVVLGGDRSSLGDIARDQASAMRVRLSPEAAPEKGFFFRSDHFPFARAGVPAVAIEHGLSFRGRPADWGARQLEEYEAQRYHQPGDVYNPAWDLTGAVQQARFAFLIGFAVADGGVVPEWYEGAGFGRVR